MSRRRFATGAGAAAGVGAITIVAVGPDRVLHRLGLRHSPDHQVPSSGWKVVEQRLASTAMGRDVTWAMATPPQPATGVIVCLRGRGGDHREAFDSIQLHDVVAQAGSTLAVVGVDGGTASYWHRRADGTDALAMVLDELLPAIDHAVGRVLPRAILGWSMGGYGALLAAERAPERFRAVVAASPALWARAGDSAPGAFDDPADFAAHDVFAGASVLAAMTVRVDCGTSDGFIAQARRFAQQLSTPNHGSFGPGFHDAAYWRSIAPAQVATIDAALRA